MHMFKVMSERGRCPKGRPKGVVKEQRQRIQAKKEISVILINVSQTIICIQITGVLVKHTDCDLVVLKRHFRFYVHRVPVNNNVAS